MKKTIKTMLAFVAGALCLAGCAKEDVFEANGPKLVTLTAYQEGDDATKAAIDGSDSKKIDWTSGDQINYFGGATGESMTLKTGAGTTSATFEGTVTPGTTDYALYPYQSTATNNAGVITAEVPMTQYAVANSFDPAAALMVGVVNGSTVEFKNVMSYVKVTIPEGMTNCKQVSLKAKDAWTTVAGKVKINATDATWTETDAKEGQAFVRLVPTSPATTLTAGASYYIAILPQTMATGFELIFNDNDVIKVKQSASSSVEFGRSKTKKLGAITSFTYTVSTVTAGTMTLADRNIGAATTESTDYGDYFAWAALRPAYSNKTTPTWYWSGGFTKANTPYYNGSAYTKYSNAEDNLDASDDIASMLWGGNWRIPTSAEWDANKTDTNVKALPLGGCYDSLDDGTILRHVGESSAYWASDTQAHNEYADDGHQANYYFNQTTPFPMSYVAAEGRLVGRNVRPVLAASAPAADPNLLPGKFSVSATKKVQFTKGNLQATYSSSTSSYTWGFAANQYDYIGNAKGNTTINSQSDGAVVDLFVQSTDAPKSNWGINTAGNTGNSSFVDGSFKDWGKLFSDKYSTLSKDEWYYLLKSRSCAKQYALAMVNGVKGMILFPDDYSGATSGTGISTNMLYPGSSIPTSTWTSMESAGVVFLPAAGYREGSSVSKANEECYYSSSSLDSSNASVTVKTGTTNMGRYYAASVRLVSAN